jgi:large subunit ribosomal protein L23
MNPYLIKRPVITEKSVRLANERNTYTFEVAQTATKNQVAQALSELYGVDVVTVRTIVNQANVARTGRRRLKTMGTKVKKALVTLKKNQRIDLFDITENQAEK